MPTRLALIAATLMVLLAPVARAADPTASTKKLIAVLQSDAPLFEKARACQQLGEIGTPEAVPVLAGLLTDPKLSAYARSGLEGIPDPSAAAALRDAAQKIKGPLLAGVVNSLGVLRDPKSVELLAALAADPASGLVKEALLALGNISTPASIRLLEEALASGPDTSRGEAAAGCLVAADRQRTSGDLNRAVVLYDLIRKAKVPTACRVGATRGAILARKADRVPFLIEQLRSEELAIRNAALLTIREVPDDALATALNAEIARATPELQGQLLLALADCHNAQSIPVIQALVGSQNPQIRKTALTVLGRIGPSAASALLAALQKEQPAEERSVVLNGLKALEGPAVDDLLLEALTSASAPGLRIDLIRLLDSRGVAKVTPEILKQAAAPEKDVSIAALSAMKSLAGPNELPGLIALTRSCSDEGVRDAAENALAGVCSRSGDAASETVLNDLKQATTAAERNCWINVLARVGYAKALPAIEAAASDPDSAVADNALAQLGRWPDAAPMETLLKAMNADASPGLRKRALVSVIDLATTAADEGQVPEPTIVSWLQRANAVAQSTEDKRRILGLLGRLKTVESFRLLAPYLEDARLRTEAASAVVQIAPALAKGEDAGALKATLEKIAVTVANADLRGRALQVAKTIPTPVASLSLFDGRSLGGWEGDTNFWRVREGVIVGGSMNGNPRNEFLATVRKYTNFVLRLEYKLIGTEGFVNSGVQFRSVRVSNPPNEMNGYQADIGAGYSGCLYDEARRNTFLARPSEETIKRLEKTGDWNRYEVRCDERHIQLWLNGEKTVDYTEPDAAIPQSGLIGLQIHGGNKAEVSFRSIMIQEL
jgi:HEAT repeat protein